MALRYQIITPLTKMLLKTLSVVFRFSQLIIFEVNQVLSLAAFALDTLQLAFQL